MKKRIDIIVPDSVLDDNPQKIERFEKTKKLEPTDRVPVYAGYYMEAMLIGSGNRFRQMIESPQEQMRCLIENQKWRMENVRDDFPLNIEQITIEPNFGALRGVEFPIEIKWHGDDMPKSVHPLKNIEEIDNLAIPSPDSGVNAKRIEYFKAMRKMVGDYDIRLNGNPIELKVDLNHPGGPIPSAFALCGPNLFMWMILDPDRIHKLLEITTKSHLQVIKYFDELTGREPGHWVWAGCDTGELISPAMFKEFVVPYYRKIWKVQNRPRVFHMCGKINHLLEIIRDDMEIDVLEHFGFPTDRNKLAATFAGKILLRGGPHPALIKDGPPEKIIAECVDYITTVGQKGGFILSEGATIVPGTPLEHIDAMVDASKRVGNIVDKQ